MNERPRQIALNEAGDLVIDWSDDRKLTYKVSALRDRCPCATCREKRKAEASGPPNLLPVLTIEEARPLKIVDMKPVGTYAYGITFSDGHDSGIFTLEQLYQIGTPIDD